MADDLKDHVLEAAKEQIRDLQPALTKQVDIAAVSAELDRLARKLAGFPPDANITTLVAAVSQRLKDVQAGNATLPDLGPGLVDLYSLQDALQLAGKSWVSSQKATAADVDDLADLVLDVVRRVQQLLSYRPDVGTIMDDLAAIKHLRGGPADAEAFHDFQVLQIAFESVWLHAFDANLRSAAEQLFKETVRLYEDAGIPQPAFDAIDDIDQLKQFIDTITGDVGISFSNSSSSTSWGDPFGINLFGSSGGSSSSPSFSGPPSTQVVHYFPQAATVWSLLDWEQQWSVTQHAQDMEGFMADSQANKQAIQDAKDAVASIVKHPTGSASRLTRLIAEIGEHLSEPYAFDVFAPDSYNYGIMITYRQKWTPGEYQAGDLVATIPLAPNEVRKYTKKRTVKRTRAEKEIEKSMSSRSLQTSETSRAESEIIQKATSATNFKLTAHGSFSIGVANIDSTSDFTTNQELQSTLTKKAFHEATLKAAEEYRRERSMEIDTTSSVETEETVSGEISNPNNEITVTYLFYELQRRFKIHEFLYRVRPVILVAQEVPAPHQIDEAWLIEHQWIINRVLLDDSLRPALDYLGSGFAGDEVSLEIVKAHWQAEIERAKKLEGQVGELTAKRDALREALVSTQMKEDEAKTFEMSTAMKVFTFGLAPDPAQMAADQFEAARKSYETRLQYSEQSLVDAKDQLKQAADAARQATKEYAAALQNKFARHVAIDQLRVHVKQNIFYYMQAIWDHEPPDQRFFRLYNKKVVCPIATKDCEPQHTTKRKGSSDLKGKTYEMKVTKVCTPTVGGAEHDLVEVADIDNPLGYKGNYIIFPLKDECYLTTFMVTEFINTYLGLKDPDNSDDFDAEQFDEQWKDAIAHQDVERQAELKKQLVDYITAVRRGTDEIIVPTGQLFIEALPGSHPLLEDFKLMHRFEDVRKVKAEVRHAELENLRLATRLAVGQDKTELLEDPDIEKKVVIEGNASLVTGKP